MHRNSMNRTHKLGKPPKRAIRHKAENSEF